MIDIHTHILPGVDDGAGDMDETIKMLELEYKSGVDEIVFTPHYGSFNPDYNPKAVMKLFERLSSEVNPQVMKLHLANELWVTPEGVLGTLEELIDGRARCIGSGTYVLIEMPEHVHYIEMVDIVRSITSAGYWPIIAHAERYPCLRYGHGRTEDIINLGAYIQVNADSVISDDMWAVEHMLRGDVHFIASDCHGEKHRKPNMDKAMKALAKLSNRAGRDIAKELMDNAAMMLSGEFW